MNSVWPSAWRATISLAMLPEHSLVNGHKPCTESVPAIISAWPNLRFDEAWIDNGPSPAGNPGPYLKVPGGDESVHRVYCRYQVGDESSVMRRRGVIVGVRPWFEKCWIWLIEIQAKENPPAGGD